MMLRSWVARSLLQKLPHSEKDLGRGDLLDSALSSFKEQRQNLSWVFVSNSLWIGLIDYSTGTCAWRLSRVRICSGTLLVYIVCGFMSVTLLIVFIV